MWPYIVSHKTCHFTLASKCICHANTFKLFTRISDDSDDDDKQARFHFCIFGQRRANDFDRNRNVNSCIDPSDRNCNISQRNELEKNGRKIKIIYLFFIPCTQNGTVCLPSKKCERVWTNESTTTTATTTHEQKNIWNRVIHTPLARISSRFPVGDAVSLALTHCTAREYIRVVAVVARANMHRPAREYTRTKCTHKRTWHMAFSYVARSLRVIYFSPLFFSCEFIIENDSGFFKDDSFRLFPMNLWRKELTWTAAWYRWYWLWSLKTNEVERLRLNGRPIWLRLLVFRNPLSSRWRQMNDSLPDEFIISRLWRGAILFLFSSTRFVFLLLTAFSAYYRHCCYYCFFFFHNWFTDFLYPWTIFAMNEKKKETSLFLALRFVWL